MTRAREWDRKGVGVGWLSGLLGVYVNLEIRNIKMSMKSIDVRSLD